MNDMNFTTLRFKDCITDIIDNRGRNPDKYYDLEKYPVIDNYLIKNELHPNVENVNRYLSQAQFDSFLRGYVTTDDLLMTLVGNGIGNVSLSPNDKIAIVQNTVGFRLNKDLLDSHFAFYYFRTINSAVRNLDRGASQPSVNRTDVLRLKLQLPDINTQKRIADVLFAYDDLIENNTKRIKLLEQMAENLYKEWFVRFRFPGYEKIDFVESPFGKIPSSFELIKMNDAFDYYIGGGWGNDEYSTDFPEQAYVIRGTDFPNVQKGDLLSCPLRYHKKSNYSARELNENDIIIEVSGGTAEQPVGRALIVTKDTIDRLDNKVICASFCKLVRLNTEVVTPYFFYYWMQFLYDTRIIDKFQLQSTGIINFKFEYFLRKGDIMLPPKALMDRFDEKVKVLYKEKSILARQNDNLIKQRDLLLPRLMSGKLEV